MTKKIITLARALKELWERGEGGEAINAEKMLRDLLQKNGMTLADIEEEKVEMRFFTVTPMEENIFVIVAANVLGAEIVNRTYKSRDTPNVWALETNNSDFIELEAKYDFYKRAFKEEYDIFVIAFARRQDLYVKDAKQSEGEATERDILAHMLGLGMKKRQFRVQIGGKDFGKGFIS